MNPQRSPVTVLAGSDLARRVYLCSAVTLMSLIIVFPNALRFLTLPLFALSAILAMAVIRWTPNFLFVVVIWLASTIVTYAYALLAVLKGYVAAQPQVIFVYVISPFFWILIGCGLLQALGRLRLANFIVALGFIGTLTVYAFCVVFVLVGPAPLTWIIAEPNATLRGGVPTVAMHVFGSLLFVTAGFFSAPQLVEARWQRWICGSSLVCATILSGRSALMLALIGGVALNMVLAVRAGRLRLSTIVLTVLLAGLFLTALVVVGTWLGLDLVNIIATVADKISGFGGSERADQAQALIAGIFDNDFAGAGHGVGVPVVRSEDYPWRYELVWHATVFRVGILGALVYVLPALIIFVSYGLALIARRADAVTHFFFGGFCGAFFGVATNPYLESFDFQWMYVVPFLYFVLVVPKDWSVASRKTAPILGA